jgi:hypothetical protein
LKFKNILAPSLCALAVVLAASPVTADEPTASATNSVNGVSTGVGNAGSFGIGSGTANGDANALSNGNATSNGNGTGTATSNGNGNGNATATAISNGVTDSHDLIDSHNTAIQAGSATLSTQSLSQVVSGIPTGAGSPANDGSNVASGWRTGDIVNASNSGAVGVVTNVANTGANANVGAVTSITAGAVRTTLSLP